MSNTCCHPFSRGHASVGQRAVSTTRSAGGDVSLLNHSFGDGSTTRRCSPQTPPGRVIVVVAIATGGGGGRRQRPTQPKTGVQQHIIHRRIFYSFSTGCGNGGMSAATGTNRRRTAAQIIYHICDGYIYTLPQQKHIMIGDGVHWRTQTITADGTDGNIKTDISRRRRRRISCSRD